MQAISAASGSVGVPDAANVTDPLLGRHRNVGEIIADASQEPPRSVITGWASSAEDASSRGS